MRRALACALLASACGRIGFATGGGSETDDGRVDDGRDGATAPDALACTSFGPWSAPVRVDGILSTSDDWEASLHPGGELLAFASERGDSSDLYLARRAGATWSIERAISELNTTDADLSPAWSADGTRLFFARGATSPRLFEAAYDGTGFSAAMMVPGLETRDIASATVTADGEHMIYSSYFGRLSLATWTGSAWQYERTADEIGDGIFPTLTSDGTTVYFESTVNGPLQIWQATRPSPTSPFTAVSVVTPLDLPVSSEGDPKVSADGRTMFLSSTPPDASADVFVSTRACQ